MSSETLNGWLKDAHNYPDEMSFQVDERAIGDVVDYMLRLKDPNYRPVG